MSPVQILSGNLFDSQHQTLTNAVNTVGVMGAGIAKEFKARYPAMYQDYKERCERGEVKTGEPYVWSSSNEAQKVLNFPTKRDWRVKSRLAWIESGLAYLVEHYREMGITSIAFPALGCNNGGLDWQSVRPVMVRYLGQLTIPVEIYEPREEKIKRQPRKKKQAKKKSKNLTASCAQGALF